jgi:hypothetical protein
MLENFSPREQNNLVKRRQKIKVLSLDRQQRIHERRENIAKKALGGEEVPPKASHLEPTDWKHEEDLHKRIEGRRLAWAKEAEKIKNNQFYTPIELKTETPEIKKEEDPLIERLNNEAYQKRVEKLKAEVGDLAKAEELAKAKPPIIPIPHITSKINYQPPFVPKEEPVGFFARTWGKLKNSIKKGW